MKPQFLNRYPLSYYLVAAIFLILMVAVVGLIGISYLATERTLEENARAVELQTENNLVAVFRSKEEGIRIYEESLNGRMEEAFPPFAAEYERAGRDPSRMDLEAVKAAIGGEMELYVIDENATIVATTYAPELGLRFGDFAPYFAEYLNDIRLSGGFHPDRIVSEKSTGAMKKFAYLPTPDQRYILELGLPVTLPDMASFRYLDKDLIMQVERSNPYMRNVRVFDTTLRLRENDTSVEINDPALKDLLRGVLANRSTFEIADPQSGITTRYLFVDLENDAFGADVSRIIELTYSDQPVREALSSSIIYYLSLGLIGLLICAILSVIAIKGLTRPIENMVDDVDIIAGGDLDHPLTPPIGKELIKLEESISAMVSRLKAMIIELRTSEEDYRNLVQSANSIVIRSRTDGTIRFINAYGREFFEYPEEEIIGKTVFETILPEIDEQGRPIREKYRGYFANPGLFAFVENENRTRSGKKVWVSWTNKPLYDLSGNAVEILSIGNDITRLKQVEKEIQLLNRELEHRVADRTRQLVEVNRNLESFTYSVSHDLRAPLRAISGFSSILLQDLKEIPEKDKKYLELLRQNAHDMGQLIDDLLSFSRLGQHSLQKKVVQPATIVREIIQDLGTETNLSSVEFKIGKLPLCQADPVLMRQVLSNLLSNAIKFSRSREHPVVEIGSLVKDGKQTYFVRDNGIGFDMRYASKIFGVFERLHDPEEYEGTGVGLAIVHRIIELHGGKIWVESELGRGTTFYFTCEE